MRKQEKILIIILLAIIIILVGAIGFLITNNSNNPTNQTNNTTNTTSEIVNATLVVSEDSSSQVESSVESEPEYGSDEYVNQWDKSQQEGNDWAYLHDQPVKTENGHKYKRMYDEDSGKSYWYQMDQDSEE